MALSVFPSRLAVKANKRNTSVEAVCDVMVCRADNIACLAENIVFYRYVQACTWQRSCLHQAILGAVAADFGKEAPGIPFVVHFCGATGARHSICVWQMKKHSSNVFAEAAV